MARYWRRVSAEEINRLITADTVNNHVTADTINGHITAETVNGLVDLNGTFDAGREAVVWSGSENRIDSVAFLDEGIYRIDISEGSVNRSVDLIYKPGKKQVMVFDVSSRIGANPGKIKFIDVGLSSIRVMYQYINDQGVDVVVSGEESITQIVKIG